MFITRNEAFRLIRRYHWRIVSASVRIDGWVYGMVMNKAGSKRYYKIEPAY
ncbi:MAG: hypothetical protein WC449_06300 [Candidatus Paceibacterota bacterium]